MPGLQDTIDQLQHGAPFVQLTITEISQDSQHPELLNNLQDALKRYAALQQGIVAVALTGISLPTAEAIFGALTDTSCFSLNDMPDNVLQYVINQLSRFPIDTLHLLDRRGTISSDKLIQCLSSVNQLRLHIQSDNLAQPSEVNKIAAAFPFLKTIKPIAKIPSVLSEVKEQKSALLPSRYDFYRPFHRGITHNAVCKRLIGFNGSPVADFPLWELKTKNMSHAVVVEKISACNLRAMTAAHLTEMPQKTLKHVLDKLIENGVREYIFDELSTGSMEKVILKEGLGLKTPHIIIIFKLNEASLHLLLAALKQNTYQIKRIEITNTSNLELCEAVSRELPENIDLIIAGKRQRLKSPVDPLLPTLRNQTREDLEAAKKKALEELNALLAQQRENPTPQALAGFFSVAPRKTLVPTTQTPYTSFASSSSASTLIFGVSQDAQS